MCEKVNVWVQLLKQCVQKDTPLPARPGPQTVSNSTIGLHTSVHALLLHDIVLQFMCLCVCKCVCVVCVCVCLGGWKHAAPGTALLHCSTFSTSRGCCGSLPAGALFQGRSRSILPICIPSRRRAKSAHTKPISWWSNKTAARTTRGDNPTAAAW